MSEEKLRINADQLASIAYDGIRALKAKNKAAFDESAKAAKALGVSAKDYKKVLNNFQKDSVDYGFLRSLAQGITFGFADEIEALGKSAVGDKDYAEELTRIRSGKAAYEGEYPVRSAAAEIAGAIPSMLLPFGMAAKGVQTVGKAVLPSAMMTTRGGATAAPTFMGEGVKATAVGAGEGFLGGYGRGEGASESLQQGLQEGIIGGVAAPVIQGAIGGGTRLIQAMQPVERVAQQRVGATIPRGEEARVASEIERRVAREQTVGEDLPETMADVIGGTAPKTVKATRMGGEQEFDVEATKFLTERAEDAPTRVSQAVGDFGEGLGVDVFEELDPQDLIRIRDDAAYAAYQPIREANPDLSIRGLGFDKFFDDDMISESVYNKVIGDMRRLVAGGRLEAQSIDGVPSYAEIKKALDDGNAVDAPFAFFDQLQREIADIGRKGMSGETRTGGASYKSIADQMDDSLRRNVDGYAEAKAEFKANSDVVTAAELGKKAAGKAKTAATVQRELSRLSGDAKKAYIQSALNRMVTGFDTAGTDYAARILKSAENKSKLRAMVGDQPDAMYEELIEKLVRERRMMTTGREMTPRSDTAQNLSMMQQQGFDVTQSPIQQAQARLLEGIVSNLPSRRSAVTQRAGEMLMQTDPAQQLKTLRGVQKNLPIQRKIENLAVGGGRVARVPSLLSPILDEDRRQPVTIYTDEQMRRMGMGGLLK